MQKPKAQTSRYRGRKMSARKWRNHLWTHTLTEQHYRSSGNASGTLTTPASIAEGTVVEINPTFLGVPGPTTAFWTVTGGIQPVDTGVAAPAAFSGDLIIRGGQVGMTLSAADAVTDEIAVSVFECWLAKNADDTVLPATLEWGTMIDFAPDFANFGKILSRKDMIINNQYPAVTFTRRLRPQKIDQEQFAKPGQQFCWIVVVANLTQASAETINIVTWHDLSFTGDVDNDAI
ncbi:MAG: putative capsid protein [Anthevirus perseuis]|uniref:Capsid protein n=1 Tax=Cressdnaviricota sp. TaxID=2748378 RepID=A0A345BP68_9VIRU|nr:MAG: putative capsid protein [Cressdnaviricota sp.]